MFMPYPCIHVVTFTLISILATDYIQKRRGEPGLKYRKVASSNTSRLEAHAGFFRLLMKGILDPYVL